MKARATMHGAITVVNAIAAGKGAALGVDLNAEAEVELLSSSEIGVVVEGVDEPVDTSLVQHVILEVLRRYSLANRGARVAIRSEIPVARGLKSSSAISSAVALAACSAAEVPFDDQAVLDIGVQASLDAGVSITGALDDAAACYLGGLVFTDNLARKIISRAENEVFEVAIYVPEHKLFTKDFNREAVKPYRNLVEKIFDLAQSGAYLEALTMNGLVYSTALGYSVEPVLLALSNGALASGISGTGPAISALCESASITKVVEAWGRLDGTVLRTNVNNSKATVVNVR